MGKEVDQGHCIWCGFLLDKDGSCARCAGTPEMSGQNNWDAWSTLLCIYCDGFLEPDGSCPHCDWVLEASPKPLDGETGSQFAGDLTACACPICSGNPAGDFVFQERYDDDQADKASYTHIPYVHSEPDCPFSQPDPTPATGQSTVSETANILLKWFWLDHLTHGRAGFPFHDFFHFF